MNGKYWTNDISTVLIILQCWEISIFVEILIGTLHLDISKTSILTVKKKSRQFEKGHLDMSRHLDLNCSQLSRSPGLTNWHLQIVNKTNYVVVIKTCSCIESWLMWSLEWKTKCTFLIVICELLSLGRLDCINHSNNQWSH